MRAVAIIQARMGSSRLPGKVLMALAGKPLLWHIVHRLCMCRTLDEMVVATSSNAVDDPIEEFCLGEDVKIVRGPEDNVLARFALAAEQLCADIILRVCGDSPLIDPATIDLLVETLIDKQADYCTGDSAMPSIHEGFSPFTFRALQKLINEAGADPVAREHVTAYFKKHPGFVSVAKVTIGPEYQFSGAHLSVDTPADLCFLEKVYSHLKVPAGEADIKEVVRLLRLEPDLVKINAHVHQKKMVEQSRRILFRCDGDTELGLGHIYRCLALADELRERHGFGVSFAVARGSVAVDLVKRASYPIENKADDIDENSWLDEIIHRLHPDALVLDVRSELDPISVKNWRNNGQVIVTIDDPSQRRCYANLAFYPPVPQVKRMDWSNFTGDLYVGWDWAILRKEFLHPKNCNYSVDHGQCPKAPVILVSMGGSDPQGMTLKAVSALDALDVEFDSIVVLGAGFMHKEKLDNLLSVCRHRFEILENAENMDELMAQSDLAVASFGITAYELAAMGVPAIYLCLTSDHAESASVFVDAGLGMSLGLYNQASELELAKAIRNMLIKNSSQILEAKHTVCLKNRLVDGKGAIRIAKIIADSVVA